MSKPPTVIAEPFTPPVLNHVPSTRTQGNRFAVVTRALCGRKTSKELVSEYGTEGYLSRPAWKSITRVDGVGRLEVDFYTGRGIKLRRCSRSWTWARAATSRRDCSARTNAPRRRTWTASSGSRPRRICTSGSRCGGAFRRTDNNHLKQLGARVPVLEHSPAKLVRKRRREEECDLARRLSARPRFLSCASARDKRAEAKQFLR